MLQHVLSGDEPPPALVAITVEVGVVLRLELPLLPEMFPDVHRVSLQYHGRPADLADPLWTRLQTEGLHWVSVTS